MSQLKAGDKAPEFTANDQNGKPVSLADFKGKTVILYFYPKDNTPTCTVEACDFRDNYQSLLGKGYQVIGVSADDEKSHKKFEKKFNLPFPLIADTDMKIVNAYGVWGDKVLFGREYQGILRTTFIIDAEGKIAHVIDKVTSATASQQVLDLVG
ncbi:thioredoxin-dependent thiol peroxidase [Mucilaginibacter calamicampi]|uniref:thioredoxin-dependent peroxiredoxin n=1 Tax=Mucilaginibacter calamicampi TaxID=1302352 RepID=A0ABW2YY78_9SPHI